MPRRARPPSVAHQARRGDAPSVAATWRMRGSTDRSSGRTTLMTTGSATSAWPRGTRIHEPRMSIGPRSDTSRSPKPMVTEETPSGRASAASIHAPRLPAARIPAQASAPSAVASRVATAAYCRDRARDSAAEAARVVASAGEKASRYHASPQPSPTRSDRATRARRGMAMAAASAQVHAAQARSHAEATGARRSSSPRCCRTEARSWRRIDQATARATKTNWSRASPAAAGRSRRCAVAV